MSVPNINHVVLTGRLTCNPDLRVLPSGSSVCHLRIAVNARRRNSAGVWSDKPNFFSVIVYGARGESVAKHMHTGRALAIDGRLDWREWTTESGGRAQAVSIVAKTVQFLGSPPNTNTKSVADGDTGVLQGIAGDEEESLDAKDQDAIALAAAEG